MLPDAPHPRIYLGNLYILTASRVEGIRSCFAPPPPLSPRHANAVQLQFNGVLFLINLSLLALN